jgi:putative ABC transport system substrate-binding protein
MQRRNFITLPAVAVGWPFAAYAQRLTVPLIGLLSSRSREDAAAQTAALLQGLKAFGYIDGQTARIEYRWASGDYGRLPALAEELVSQQPTIIIATGGALSAHAAKAASGSIPIVFVVADPVADDVVVSLARPGGNITGVSLMSSELGGKRLELLVQLVPDATVVGLLSNPQNKAAAPMQQVGAAARTLGRRLVVTNASTEPELEAAFAALAKAEVKALVVQNDAAFDARRDHIIALANQWRIPTIFHIRQWPVGGALMSYGASLVDAYRQAGVQAGRILKGAKISDLPVMQPTRFEMVINLKTARALNLTVPPALLAEADEVIE